MPYRITKGGGNAFRAEANRLKKRVRMGAEAIVGDVVAEAVVDQKHTLDTATTTWGNFRKSQGRESAGRRERDTMYDAITSTVKAGRTSVVGEWGWLRGALKYFLVQEHGSGTIGAANSLAQSKVQADQNLAAQVKARTR